MNQEQLAGSPPTGEPVFVVIGKIRKPFGLRGELTMEVLTDFPERISPKLLVYVGESHCSESIQSCRWHGKLMLITFEGKDAPETVQMYRNQWVYVRTEGLPLLPNGEYYHHELIGLRVFDDQGKYMGILTNILETGANDVYVVRLDTGSEILLPAIENVILDIDINRGELHAHILPGLLPE